MTKVTPEIMRTVGKIVAAVYGSEVPTNVQNTIIYYPLKGFGLMMRRGDIKANSEDIAHLMQNIPSDLEDPKNSMSFECQGAFWLGYYHYQKVSDDINKYGGKELEIFGKALYGESWKTSLANELGLGDVRRIREWLSGSREVPTGVWLDIYELLKKKQLVINELLSSQ